MNFFLISFFDVFCNERSWYLWKMWNGNYVEIKMSFNLMHPERVYLLQKQ